MKQILLALGCLLILQTGMSQTSGITFYEGNWEQILAEAKKIDKYIFVDAYTSWCGPCKKMAKEVFTQQEVADFYNAHFVNAKIDMEKGEGLLFARAYDVHAYPTFLFIDYKGNVVHKSLGYRPASSFIQLGETASDPKRNLAGLSSEFENGNREPAFLNHYAITVSEAQADGLEQIVEAYLQSQEDWLAGDVPEFIYNYSPEDPNSKLIQFIIDNRPVFEEKVGKAKIDGKLEYIAIMNVDKKQRADRELILASFQKLFPEDGAMRADKYLLQNLIRRKDDVGKQAFLEAAQYYMTHYEVNEWQLLNAVAWHVYEVSDDKLYLSQAKKWAKRSTDLNGNYYNFDTLAAICYKLGEKSEGISFARKAIEKAKADGREPKETNALLKKLEAL